ncbi:hypothetical protein OE88DRAFT_1651730 [Heliocybe sulcata]|uniref:Uncharacterized protein n=1 Tax=Heliocybe sulcata TaxID=5364 RepID=A0A5C3NDK2_9AGAM|nr:hypothetical protein OE88DRAFT_1651730 [Heliocybe sulcata]
MPKPQPRNLIFPVKTHSLTIYVSGSQTSTVADLKDEVLSAFQANVMNQVDGLPEVITRKDFELCKALRDKGRLTGKYDPLEESAGIKGLLMNWDTLAVQYRDPETGLPLPIELRVPSQYDDDEEPTSRGPPSEARSPPSKGKRKAPPQ